MLFFLTLLLFPVVPHVLDVVIILEHVEHFLHVLDIVLVVELYVAVLRQHFDLSRQELVSGRVGDSVYEKWTEKLPDIDWASYQI